MTKRGVLNRFGHSGQAATEMVFILPLLIGVIGGGLIIVYSCWQGIKVQQGANLAARIQGEERVGGGISKNAIRDNNGAGADTSLNSGDEDPTVSDSAHPRHGAPLANSVYEHLHKAVLEMFGNSSRVYVPPPVVGQNIDQVKVVRIIQIPKIPFLKWGDGQHEIKVSGTAWGGEDTFMYGLPRWGQTQNNGTGSLDLEWRNIVGNAGAQDHD